jgi:hypothetical protein
MGDDTRRLGDMGKLGNGEWNDKDKGVMRDNRGKQGDAKG